MQQAPYRSRWSFVDSQGTVHRGKEWQVDLGKLLGRTDDPGLPVG